MRLISLICMVVLIFAGTASSAEKKDGWYAVDRFSGQCIKDKGPAEMIKSLKIVGVQYTAKDEVVENGKPMQVRLILDDGVTAGQIIYYRGMDRCKAQAAKNKRSNDAELNKYK